MKLGSYISVGILSIFSLILSLISKYQFGNGIIVFLLVMLFSITWLICVKFNIYSSIFASIVLLPADFPIKLGFFYLTISDIFILISIALFFISNRRLILNYFSIYLLLLYFVCFLSVIFSLNIALLPIIIRFLITVLFIVILYNLPYDKLYYPLTMGLINIPIILCFNLLGLGVFFDFLTFNNFNFGVVVGSHKYISFFLFLLPLLMYYKVKKWVYYAVIFYIFALIFFSISRSLTVGVLSGFAFYIFYKRKSKIQKIIYFIGSLVVSSIIFPLLVFFSFSLESGSPKEISNIQRYFKITNSLNAFQDRPIIGNGFGMSQIEKTFSEDANTSEKAVEIAMDTKFSPEFMPVQILAEAGIVGFILFFIIFIKSISSTIFIFKTIDAPNFVKILVMSILAINITNIINSNSFASMSLYLFIFCAHYFCNYYKGNQIYG